MADLINARPSCRKCGCLMVLDPNTELSDDEDRYHWVCRRSCPGERLCDGRATTPRTNVLSGPFRTEDMAIRRCRGAAPTNKRLARGSESIRRALPELSKDNPLRAYLSVQENELVDVALHVLDNLANSYGRSERAALNLDADWLALADRADMANSGAGELRELAVRFLDSTTRQGATDRARGLDEYVKRHHGESPGLRKLARDYLANPLESRWDRLIEAVGRVLTTEAYNVRPASFERYWKGWRENLPYRRALDRVRQFAFLHPAECPSLWDPHLSDKPHE